MNPEERKAETDRLWEEAEKQYAVELHLRGYLVACIEQADRSVLMFRAAVEQLTRARRRADRLLAKCRRDQDLAEEQARIIVPLLPER